MRSVAVAAATAFLLCACGDSKPKADTLSAAPDTIKAAAVPDTTASASSTSPTPAVTKTTPPKSSTKTSAGGVRPDEVGRDSVVKKPIGTIRTNEVGRDSAMIPKGGVKTIKVPKDTHP